MSTLAMDVLQILRVAGGILLVPGFFVPLIGAFLALFPPQVLEPPSNPWGTTSPALERWNKQGR
jgi:hypothetical protein